MELHTTGNTLPGINKEVVLQRLQQHLKLKENQALALVERKVIIKRDLDTEQAHLYCEKFKKLGLDVLIKEPLADKKSLDSKVPSTNKEPLATKTTTNTPSKAKQESPFPQTIQDFEAIFNEQFKQPKVSLSYKMGLLGVALLSLLTPTIYLGLIALVGWGTVSYLFSAIEWVSTMNGVLAKIIVLTGPTIIGSILFLFLIKPLFAKRVKDWGFDLQREDAPALFNLIDIMCKRINIKPPQEIRIDNSVNAAAGPENGITSLLRGKLRLYIGMPLLSGLSARQFVGVLAHEFGHFAQPGAMLTYQLINRVNHWLYDRAFTYDSWDDHIEKWLQSEYTPWFIDISVWFAKMVIKMTRFIFRQMYIFNYRMSQSMSRQMEYDADCYESIACGSDSFKEASLQLRKLSVAANKVNEINHQAWYENKLLRDYANAISELGQQLSAEEIQHIEDQMHSLETNAWDSHPADTDRITHIEQRSDKGFFFHEGSATNFCKDFNNLSERATRYQYSVARITDIDKYITNNDQILERHTKLKKGNQSLETYFAGTYSENNLLYFDANLKLDTDNAEWKDDWQKTIDSLRYKLPEHTTLSKQLDKKLISNCQQEVGRAFIDIGVEIEREDFCLDDHQPNPAQLDHEIKSLRIKQKNVAVLFQKRITYATHAAQLSSSLITEDLHKILADFIFVTELSELYQTLERQYQSAWIANEMMSLCPENPEIQSKLQKLMQQEIEFTLWESLNKQWNVSKGLPDRVDNPESSLFDYIETISGKRIESINLLSTTDLVERFYQVSGAICYQYSTVLAQLVDGCLKIEKENGIKPIRLV